MPGITEDTMHDMSPLYERVGIYMRGWALPTKWGGTALAFWGPHNETYPMRNTYWG